MQTIRRPVRWLKPGQMALWLGFAALLTSCGGGANRQMDLNAGEATVSDAQERAALEQLFAAEGQDGAASETYQIQDGDKLEIVFFTHPEQNRFVTVRPDGRISLPLLGDLDASGMSPVELASLIQTGYADVLINPRVDVMVQEMGSVFYVLGEVNTPGEYQYRRRIDLLQAVARANGATNNARLSNIVLLRRGEDEKTYAGIFNLRDFMGSDKREALVELRPFDIVWVPKSALGRWDNATRKLFGGTLLAQDTIIKGWSLARFDAVFERPTF